MACVGALGVREFAVEALRDAELGPGERAARIARERLPEGLRRRVEIAALPIQDAEVDQRGVELRIAAGQACELRLRRGVVAGPGERQRLRERLPRLGGHWRRTRGGGLAGARMRAGRDRGRVRGLRRTPRSDRARRHRGE